MCYKIVFGLVKLTFSDFFAFSPSTVTRGCQYKIYVNHTVEVSASRSKNVNFFAERVVGPWNSLPADTDFGTLKRFKLSIKSIDFKKFLHIESLYGDVYFHLCLLLLYCETNVSAIF